MNSQDYKQAFHDIKPSDELNEKIINQLLINKVDNLLMTHKKNRLKLAVICILLISVSSISVAAYALNLPDIFKGYFKEPASNQSIAKPIENDSAFLNKAGAIIEATDTKAGLKLTARGSVGDDRALYVAIDVETTNGKAFTNTQEKTLNELHFQEVKFQLDNDALGQYTNNIRIDDGSVPGKATFLIRDIINHSKVKNINGHQLKITLTNFLQTTNDLEDIGMDGNLYDIFTEFKTPAQEDYQFYSARSDHNHAEEENKIIDDYNADRKSGKLTGDAYLKRREELIQAGLVEPLYILPETSTKVSFCSEYPKLEITNMGIKDNIFTFNVNMNDELDYQYLNTKRLTLVNRKTGECVGSTMDIDRWEGDKDGKLLSAHFVVFHTITSPEQLKDYYLAIGGDGAEDILNEGIWELNFNLSYEDTSRDYNLDQKATLSGFSGTIKSMEISPLSMKVVYQTDKPMNTVNQVLFEDNWVKQENNIYLMMKDGSRIDNIQMNEEIQNDMCVICVIYPYVIDLDQIDKVVIDGNEILVNE